MTQKEACRNHCNCCGHMGIQDSTGEKRSLGSVWSSNEKRKLYCVNGKTTESVVQGKEGWANLVSLFLEYF